MDKPRIELEKILSLSVDTMGRLNLESKLPPKEIYNLLHNVIGQLIFEYQAPPTIKTH